MRQDFQGEMQVKGAHQDTLRRQVKHLVIWYARNFFEDVFKTLNYLLYIWPNFLFRDIWIIFVF